MDTLARSNYLNKAILYLKNTEITEYDMKSSGLSIIKENNLLDEATISELEAMPKLNRNIRIGKIQITNKGLRDALVTKVREYIREFVRQNGLKSNDILSIKKDAVFVLRQEPQNLKIGKCIEFRPKNTYTSYVYLSKREFYYSSVTDALDIKGIPSDIQEKCPVILSDIRKILRQGESLDWKNLYGYLKDYRNQYLERKLDVGSYKSLLTGVYHMTGNVKFDFEDIPEDAKDNVDINDNYIAFILPLIKVMI